jgi:hypothetical protein
MFMKVPELVGDWNAGNPVYKTVEVYVNLSHISLVREDNMYGRACISIVLDHNQVCLDMTMEDFLAGGRG